MSGYDPLKAEDRVADWRERLRRVSKDLSALTKDIMDSEGQGQDLLPAEAAGIRELVYGIAKGLVRADELAGALTVDITAPVPEGSPDGCRAALTYAAGHPSGKAGATCCVLHQAHMRADTDHVTPEGYTAGVTVHMASLRQARYFGQNPLT